MLLCYLQDWVFSAFLLLDFLDFTPFLFNKMLFLDIATVEKTCDCKSGAILVPEKPLQCGTSECR